MEVAVDSPFSSGTPGNIPLATPTAERVLAQIRFPRYSDFAAHEDERARAFAGAMAAQYPLFQMGQEVAVTITADGATESQSATRLWTLSSVDETWRVSFGQAFLSVETSAYDRRSDFVARLTAAWDTFSSIARPPYIERMGVRFVNRITDPDHLNRLGELFRPEVCGVMDGHPEGATLVRGLSEALYQLHDGPALQARWGLVPPNTVLDPTLPAVPVPSWLLDLDAFAVWPPGTNQGDKVEDIANDLAMRDYQFFRWALGPRFDETFGGVPA
ncbi:hypothetical protein GCM10027517_11910 [Phycicoccus ginsengisoli]